MGCGNAGTTGADIASSGQDRWELLQAPNGSAPVNEIAIYANDPAGAEYLVDEVFVRPMLVSS
jgi:hypothetical protein